LTMMVMRNVQNQESMNIVIRLQQQGVTEAQILQLVQQPSQHNGHQNQQSNNQQPQNINSYNNSSASNSNDMLQPNSSELSMRDYMMLKLAQKSW
jgi:hypothetical protein